MPLTDYETQALKRATVFNPNMWGYIDTVTGRRHI